VHEVLLEGGLELDIVSECPSTIESREGAADVHRYFLDPVVVAASVEVARGDATEIAETAAGALLSVYRTLPGYQRRSRPELPVPGASATAHLEFVWESAGGDLMHSAAVVAADGYRVAVVHATAPDLHGDAVFDVADGIVRSARLSVESQDE